jgi:hypothetical protein
MKNPQSPEDFNDFGIRNLAGKPLDQFGSFIQTEPSNTHLCRKSPVIREFLGSNGQKRSPANWEGGFFIALALFNPFSVRNCHAIQPIYPYFAFEAIRIQKSGGTGNEYFTV